MFNRNFFLGSGCYAVQTIWLVCLRPGIHHLYIKHLRNKWCSHTSGSTCIVTRILETVPVYLNIMTKAPWVRGEFVWLNPFNRSQSVREARIKLKVGTEAETKEEILPTTCSHDLHSQPSLHNSGAPAWRWHCPQWDEPSQINHSSRKRSTDMLTGQPDGGNPSVGAPSPQVTLVCCKLTKN